MKCQIKACEGNALVAYCSRWICGGCFMKLRQKEIDKQNKLIEELENDKDMSELQ